MKNVPFAVILFVTTSVGLCQTPPVKERDALQALLDEVHQLRLTMEGMTGAAQRVQIALYGLQMQDSAVARATQRLDSARNKCLGLDGNRQHMAAEVQRMESGLSSSTITEREAKEFKERLPGLKRSLEEQTAEAQTCQAAEAEASSQLRNDQAKLLDLQDRITRLDKALEQLGSPGK